jgi:tetratricopeptide (TPR) repeat protein
MRFQARAKLFSGEGEMWLARLNADVGNFRAVLAWSQTADQARHIGWQLIPGLVWFAYRRGYLHEARRWCETALGQTAVLGDDALRASILIHAGLVAMWQSDLTAAARLMDEGLAMMRRLEATAGLLDALFPCCVLAVNRGDMAQARPLFAEAIPLYAAENETWFLAMLYLHRGNVHFNEADLAAAANDTEATLRLGRQIDDPWIIASAINNLGELSRYQGDVDQAEAHYRESQALFQQTTSAPDVARAQHSLGWLSLARDNLAEARSLFRHALALHQQLGIKRGVVECLAGLAAALAVEAASEDGDEAAATAVTLFAAAAAQYQQLGAIPWPADAQAQAHYLALARVRLEESAFAAAWQRGEAMPFVQALALAA